MSFTHLTQASVQAQKDELEKFCASPELTLVVYGAGWCGPCQSYEPILKKYASSEGAIEVMHVDVDEAPEVSEKIETVPTTHLYRGGERVGEIRGALNLRSLRAFIAEQGAI